MIAVSKGGKRYAYPKLAYTPAREIAYYMDGAMIPPCAMIDDEMRSATSESGMPWIPEVLDNGRLTIFIAGNPGAGKSFLAKELIQELPSTYDVLLFTALEEEDGNFGDLGGRLYKIKMTPENLKRLTLTEIRSRSKNPILLFDDIDKIRDKTVEKLTYAILEDALANGRGHKAHDGKGDVHTIVTSHSLNDYIKTKYSLENSDFVGLFPGSTTKAQYERMFKKLGLSTELCERTYEMGKKGQVRSIIIRKVAPMYIIYGNTIELI